MSPPLKNKKVLVTREKSQARLFSNLLLTYDAIPIEVPLLKINCSLQSSVPIPNMSCFNWIFFTSVHGVNCFFNGLTDVALLKYCKFATVGHKTEMALRERGFEAQFIPSVYNAEVMAKEFLQMYPNVANILLVRGNISRYEIKEEFEKNHINFETLTVYETTYNLEVKENLLHTLTESQIDFLTFTSPSTVQSFYTIVKDDFNYLDFLEIPSVCIGTTTERAAIDYGFKRTMVPKQFTIEGMVDRMIDFVNREESIK